MCQSTVRDAAAPVKRSCLALGIAAALWLAATTGHAQHLAHVSGMVHGTSGGFGSSFQTRAQPVVRLPSAAHRRLPFPYALGYSGIRAIELGRERRIDCPLVVGIVDASAGYVLHDIVRGQLSARLRIAGVIDVEARYDAYFERTGAAIHGIGLARLGLGLTMLTDDAFELRAGAALLVYQDVVGIEAGYAATAELDVYPITPLVLRAEASGGQVGAPLFLDVRATLGLQLGRAELYVGYHALFLATETQSDTLQGPVGGIRIWIS